MTATDLTLVIPLFNEEGRLGPLAEELARFREEAAHLSVQALLVNDGSTDATLAGLHAIARELAAPGRERPWAVEVVDLGANQGKGRALRAGVLAARGRWVLTLDADMACSPVQVLAWERQGWVDLRREAEEQVFIGSREHPDSKVTDFSRRRFMGRVFNLLTQTIADVDLDDTQCGFKLYPRRTARRAFSLVRHWGWAHDVGIIKTLQAMGCPVTDLPVRWEAQGGSKIRPMADALAMLAELTGIVWFAFTRLRLGLGLPAEAPPMKDGRLYPRLTMAWWLVLIGLALFTFRDYAPTLDEPCQSMYGRQIIRYFTSAGADKEALSYFNFYYYGGLFDVAAELFAKLWPPPAIEARHLFNALVGILGIVGASRLAGILGGARAGFFAALFLALVPAWYGHMFNNPKDIPFAVGYVWAVYFLARCLPHFPRVPKGLVLKLGLAMGACLGVRVGGALLAAYLIMAAVMWAGWRAVAVNQPGPAWRDLGCLFLRFILPAGFIAYVIMLATWPWAQQSPLLNPLRAFEKFSAFQDFTLWDLYDGTPLPPDRMPRSYLPRYLLIMLPEFLLALLLGWAGLALAWLARAARGWRAGLDWPGSGAAMTVFAALFPLAYAVATRPILYDTFRHFLFVVPPLAVAAALTWERGLACAKQSPVFMRLGLQFPLYAMMALTLVLMVRLHPAQQIHYNLLVGGLPGAYQRWPLDYWGFMAKEAEGGLLAYLKAEQGADFPRRDYRVHTRVVSQSLDYVLPPQFDTVTNKDEDNDFYLASTTTRTHKPPPYRDARLLFTVDRLGVPLFEARDLRPWGGGREWLADWLAQRGITAVYSTHPRLPTLPERKNPVEMGCPLYAADTPASPKLDAAPQAAWLELGDPQRLAADFRGLGIGFQVVQREGYALFHDFRPPPARRELDPIAWQARASGNGEMAVAAFDRDRATEWNAGSDQAPGQYFLLDLGREEAGVCGLGLWNRDPRDLPVGLLIETSRDGRTWDQAATVQGDRGAFFWAEGKPMFTRGAGPLEAGFTPRPARYLRLTLTGSRQGFRWSLGELAVYAVAEPESAPVDGAAAARAALTAAGQGGRVLAPPWLAAQARVMLDDPAWSGPRPEVASEGEVDSPRGLVIICRPMHAAQVRDALERAGWTHQARTIGGYVVARLTGRVSELELAPLPAMAWRAQSDANPQALVNLDGHDGSARWDTGQAQRPGLGLTVTLERPATLAGLRLAPGAWPGDFPWAVTIEAMDEGGGWEPLEATWHPQPPLYFNGSLLLAQGRAHELASFAPRRVKGLRLRLAAASQGTFWSIARLDLLTPLPPEQGKP